MVPWCPKLLGFGFFFYFSTYTVFLLGDERVNHFFFLYKKELRKLCLRIKIFFSLPFSVLVLQNIGARRFVKNCFLFLCFLGKINFLFYPPFCHYNFSKWKGKRGFFLSSFFLVEEFFISKFLLSTLSLFFVFLFLPVICIA